MKDFRNYIFQDFFISKYSTKIFNFNITIIQNFSPKPLKIKYYLNEDVNDGSKHPIIEIFYSKNPEINLFNELVKYEKNLREYLADWSFSFEDFKKYREIHKKFKIIFSRM